MRLEVNDLHVRYGRVHAVRGVSLAVEEGEVVAVLGANGAGKSSLLKALMGLEPAAEGRVTLDGTDITRWSTSGRVQQHLALVPEGRRIVTSLTVHENLLMGAFVRKDMRAVDAEIADIYARFPNLAAAAWYLDVNGQAAQALHAAEAPVVIGVEGDAIAWIWKGLALQPAAFDATLSGWLKE